MHTYIHVYTHTHIQIDIRKYVSLEQANSFVRGKGGSFPAPQYVKQVQCMVGNTAIVLMGDAIHAFPPDVS